MSDIRIEHKPSHAKLDAMGVDDWPIWTKEVSKFPWTYDTSETCYILEGEVMVTPAGGKPVQLGSGDLVFFPRGLSCTWDITTPIRKHYKLD
jgi:uncharacterized cupin superfamily protein